MFVNHIYTNSMYVYIYLFLVHWIKQYILNSNPFISSSLVLTFPMALPKGRFLIFPQKLMSFPEFPNYCYHSILFQSNKFLKTVMLLHILSYNILIIFIPNKMGQRIFSYFTFITTLNL